MKETLTSGGIGWCVFLALGACDVHPIAMLIALAVLLAASVAVDVRERRRRV